MLNSSEVRQAALDVGFDDCGIARADALTEGEFPLRRWLEEGCQGELHYLERNADKRQDPRLLLPGARSVICVVSAYPPPDPSARGGVASYARTRDYHATIKPMLAALRQRLGIEGKLCCDTVPISDKHWAARAGLGWIGRHTLLITPRWGTWVNLGEIVTTEPCSDYADPTAMEARARFCNRCNRCVEACPNHALGPLFQARRCTAYYTTHTPRPMPPGLTDGGYTLGCDLCQLACPFNADKILHQRQ